MSFQPVLPGMGRLPRSQPRQDHFREAAETTRWHGQAEGQLVMGVHDLAHESQNRSPFGGPTKDAGFHVTDEHGFVQEGTGHQHADTEYGLPEASDLYGSHGGRFDKTVADIVHSHGTGESATELGYSRPTRLEHDAQVKEVRRHWRNQPTVMLPTDAPLHTRQSTEETKGEVGASGFTDRRTPGGRPQVIQANGFEYTPSTERPGAVPEGMKTVHKIAGELRNGGKIKKPAWVVKQGGRLFALDGHHRILAARLAGHSHVPVKLWDRDAEMGNS